MGARRKRQIEPRGREMNGKTLGLFLALVLAVMVSGLGVVHSTHRSRHLLNDLQELEKERNELQVEWGQLLLEQSSLVSQGRIEKIARSELDMVVPTMEDVVIVNGD